MRTEIAYNQQQRKAWAKTFTYETNTPHSTTSPAFSASLSKPANYISLSTPKPTPIRPIGISTRRHATLAFTLFHAERQTHTHTLTPLAASQQASRTVSPASSSFFSLLPRTRLFSSLPLPPRLPPLLVYSSPISRTQLQKSISALSLSLSLSRLGKSRNRSLREYGRRRSSNCFLSTS